MGLKKYEIITVGSDKRVRALRSWQVQDRYVNIGDVGGIVYDEKTLSQDGACWLFRGNFNFPGARIGGDSIVDVGEAVPDSTGSANLDILGTSTVVGAPVKFTVGLGATNGLVFDASHFEQGGVSYSKGTNWETWKAPSTQNVRSKAPVFMGGVAATLKVDVPGYTVQAFVMDRDGIGITATNSTQTGEGVTLSIPAGQYFVLRLAKNPAGIVPADATAARISTTAVYDAKLVVVDSRLELNPANGTGTIAIRSGGLYSITPGSKYPDSVIQDSKVIINSHASAARRVRLLSELVNVNATIDATTADAQAVGIYHGVNNLAFTGLQTSSWDEAARPLIQAYNCDNMVVSPTNFPGLATMQAAGAPIKFYGCNLNAGRFYHHTQIANTYRDINFDLATADLGKTSGGNRAVASSEVEGMYRLVTPSSGLIGGLIESLASVEKLTFVNFATVYGTTIYKDAYFNGLFDFTGTNVFGNAMKHDASNTQNVMAVSGVFNATSVGGKITGIVNNATLVCIPTPFRISGAKGLTISNLPAGFEAVMFLADANNVITRVQSTTAANTDLAAQGLVDCKAFIRFKKLNSDPVTPDEVKGVTVTTYNGCKIVNTGSTGLELKGNIRVEDNATLIDSSVIGSGYFGGSSTMVKGRVIGSAYMKDNAVYSNGDTAEVTNLCMTDNAVCSATLLESMMYLTMSENSKLLGTVNLINGHLIMRDNSSLAATATIDVVGRTTMRENATVDGSAVLNTVGDITLQGNYKQTAAKTWTGKRVIDSQNAPLYDNNVKTQYDF